VYASLAYLSSQPTISMPPTVFHYRKMNHYVKSYFLAYVAWIMAAFNVLTQWELEVNDHEIGHLTTALFSIKCTIKLVITYKLLFHKIILMF